MCDASHQEIFLLPFFIIVQSTTRKKITASDREKRGALESVVKWLVKGCPKICGHLQDWRLQCGPVHALPQQPNSIDCGLFTYKYMEQISAGM